ncbi:hypothetical protein NEHOM01_1877 [Nematocida homosporus]|uniref:uncharacterized protein n=1 Tax=Nematocida homosporus TaxID=1912981 RepID=UPI00221F5684|nr:uncharacterized protein NEHOM01_1877 [Nematocida homosporus]KAI5187032.1 hypothetical protein NEHOM01_1877 [Nematocida homosporus]
MQITYKAAEGFFLLAPIILSYIYKSKINSLLADNIFYFRVAFVLSVLLDLGIAYAIKLRVAKLQVGTKIRFVSDDYVTVTKEAKPAENKTEENKGGEEGEGEGEVETEMTVCEYDTKVINTHISKILSSALIHTAIHLVVKTPQPIMMLILNPLKNMFFFPMYIEYVRGRSMLRPFSRNVMFEIGEKKSTEEGEEKVGEEEEEKEKKTTTPPKKDKKLKKEE